MLFCYMWKFVGLVVYFEHFAFPEILCKRTMNSIEYADHVKQ